MTDGDLRVPRRRRPDAAAGLRDLRGDRRRRPWRRRRQRAAVPAVLLGGQHRRRGSAVGVLHDAPASRASCRRTTGAEGRDRATSAARCSCRSSTPTQAPYSGDLRQLSIQALCTNRDLVLQMPMGLGESDFSLDIAAPVTSVRRDRRPEPAVLGAGGRRDRLARDQSSVAQLPVAGRCHRAGGGGRAARSARALRGDRRRERAAADRGHPVGERRSRRAPAAGAGPDRLRARPRDHRGRRRAGVRGRERVPARRGARSLLRAVRVDQLVHRNRAAVADREARSTDGRHNWGARPTL